MWTAQNTYQMIHQTSSSETQGQIVGTRESLNERKNVARRKVKNGEKSPWGQCLTRPVPNGRRRSGFWLVPERHKFSGTNQKPELRRPFGTVCSFHIYFSAHLDSPSPQLSAPGSPRMSRLQCQTTTFMAIDITAFFSTLSHVFLQHQ